MAVKRNYRINLRNYGNPPAIMVSQYDENYDLVFEVYDGVVPATGLNAYTVKLAGRQPGNDPALKYEFTGTVSGIANNILSFTIDTTMTGRAGKGTAEIVILDTTNDVKFASFNLPVYVEKAAVPDDAIDADVERAQEIADEVQEIVDTAAAEVKGEAEAWAVGQRDGEDVPSTDPTYENNAKYYAEQAQDIADSIGIDATLSISGKAADAKKTGDEISSLKEDLNKVYVESANIYNQATDRHNTTIDGNNGVISASDIYKVSDYIYVGAGKKVTIQVVTNLTLRVFFYTTNDSSGFSRALWITGTEYQTVQLANTESYIVIQLRENCPDFMVNMGDTLLPYAPYGGEAGTFLQSVIDEINDTISAETESLRETSVQKDLINRFDPSTISEGKYINVNNGSLSSNDAFFASDFIYIGDLESVNVSYTHIFGWYDANKNWLGHPDTIDSISNDLTFDVPENAEYLRFSTYTGDLALAQIGDSVSRSNYVSYGKYTLPDLIIAKEQIVVDANGNGDYTSLTKALYDNVDNGIDIIVKQGTYDIVAEYVELFGQSAVDNMADSDGSIFNGFQYGIIIRNRKIEFTAGSHVVCDWTGHIVNGTHRFSAIRVDYNCEIIGLDLLSIATFYAIHDDYGLSVPYTVKYENCRVEGRNLTNANCIGGGCKKYSRHILKNCHFNNNLTGSATVRYHNTNAEGAEPEIYVSNCYFNNWFTPRWYGPQTSKMKVYVNNCEARSIHKLAESSSFNVDNVDLYKWCNTETDPIT